MWIWHKNCWRGLNLDIQDWCRGRLSRGYKKMRSHAHNLLKKRRFESTLLTRPSSKKTGGWSIQTFSTVEIKYSWTETTIISLYTKAGLDSYYYYSYSYAFTPSPRPFVRSWRNLMGGCRLTPKLSPRGHLSKGQGHWGQTLNFNISQALGPILMKVDRWMSVDPRIVPEGALWQRSRSLGSNIEFQYLLGLWSDLDKNW